MKEGSNKVDVKNLFRFKELKTYGDTEWILDNKKKYRQVFDKSETSYIYVEFSLYNKKFDIENWELDLNLKCTQLEPKTKEVCNLHLTKKISKYDAISYIREGWGNKKKSSFWKEGKYQWDLYVDDNLLGSKIFHINDCKDGFHVTNYLDVKKIELFEGAFDDISSQNNMKYLISFSQSHTRYIFCHLHFENALNKTWVAEFFVKFYNEQGDLKTIINRLVPVDAKSKINETIAGFGSNTRGSWSPGRYKIEILFMNSLLATTYFEVGDELKEGNLDVHLAYKDFTILKGPEVKKKENFKTTITQLHKLIGLSEIKEKVDEHAQYLKFLQLRTKKGFKEDEKANIHSVFIGNPGTGKTTVARLMGRIYQHMGLLSKGHVHEVDRVDLIGEFIGQTAPKVKEAIAKAKGGILFVDEAYSLARSLDDNKDFGREAIEILIKEMSGPSNDMAVIVAGYPKEMKLFIDSNPGLKSRFKHFFEFKDYLPDELIQIADVAAIDKGVILDERAKSILAEIITDAFRNRDNAFGNARYVYDLVEKAKINLGLRIMKRKNPSSLAPIDLQTIKLSDVLPIKRKKNNRRLNLPIDEDLLLESMVELDNLIGIESVKEQVRSLVDIVKYHKLSGKNVTSSFFLHTVMIGNPGTGKTTIARILAKIYKALGILERGHLVETDRQGLVAGFVGQTAIKTSEKIDEAKGGVLFIDEAYALNNFNGMQGDFGNEAIQTILKRMEDDRGSFFLFVAGYPDNMDSFLKANPGLSSRFDKKLIFQDYTADELTQIGLQMAASQRYFFNASGKTTFHSSMINMVNTKDKYFGNARAVRQLINTIITVQNLRMASENNNEISTKKLNTIKSSDVTNALARLDQKGIRSRQIGF